MEIYLKILVSIPSVGKCRPKKQQIGTLLHHCNTLYPPDIHFQGAPHATPWKRLLLENCTAVI